MGWTDERIEILTALWQDGLSASQIAVQLGSVTRNAVIGKVHCLGLSGRATPSKPRPIVFKAERRPHAVAKRPGPRQDPTPARGRPRRPGGPRCGTEGPGLATSRTLDPHMCKWPIGDPLQDNFTFCGRPSEDAGPYCLWHARVAYQPGAGKRGGEALARSLRRFLN